MQDICISSILVHLKASVKKKSSWFKETEDYFSKVGEKNSLQISEVASAISDFKVKFNVRFASLIQ